MKITLYELIGLIKDGKAPKEIKYYEATYEFNVNDYYLKGRNEIKYSMFYKLAKGYMFLNDTVEILPDENDEWEDIEEHNIKSVKLDLANVDTEPYYIMKLMQRQNQLIKNQKYLKEKLKGKDEIHS